MVFAEPPQTKLDLRFTLAGIPVRVHPLFWVVSVLMLVGDNASPLRIVLWLAAVFVSILVHELGHALAYRHYGWHPRITLYSFGGLASADPRYGAREPSGRRQIAISAAGPGAGFLLGTAVFSLVLAMGYSTHLFGRAIGSGPQIPNEAAFILVHDLIFINVFWGLMNLTPVHPLDGGQIAREILSTKFPGGGLRGSLWLSFYAGLAIAILGLVFLRSTWIALLFGYLAFMSYVVLERQHGAPGLGQRIRHMRSKWRAFWQDRARRKKMQKLKVIEEKTEQRVRSVEAEERMAMNPDIEREANDALRRISEEARRARTVKGTKP